MTRNWLNGIRRTGRSTLNIQKCMLAEEDSSLIEGRQGKKGETYGKG